MKKILVVDDVQQFRESLVDYLELFNYEVISAENGLRGYNLVETERPDLVITDTDMPEMGGFQLIEKLKKFYPEIKIILMTGGFDVNVKTAEKRALEAGAHAFWLKDEAKVLEAKIKEVLGK